MGFILHQEEHANGSPETYITGADDRKPLHAQGDLPSARSLSDSLLHAIEDFKGSSWDAVDLEPELVNALKLTYPCP